MLEFSIESGSKLMSAVIVCFPFDRLVGGRDLPYLPAGGKAHLEIRAFARQGWRMSDS
jgi:hypothetical protein